MNIPSANRTEGMTISSLDGLRINILVVKELQLIRREMTTSTTVDNDAGEVGAVRQAWSRAQRGMGS